MKNPNKTYKEQRYKRLLGEINESPNTKDFTVDCFIRVDKRRIEATCVFNEFLLYLKQKNSEIIYDDNYFRIFWNNIFEIKSQLNLGYLVEITLKDHRKIYIEFKKDNMVHINQRLSNLLRFHHESPAMLELITQLHQKRYGIELQYKNILPPEPELNGKESTSPNINKEFANKLVFDGSLESGDSEDEDPLKTKKKDSFTIISQASESNKRIDFGYIDTNNFIEKFNLMYCHSSVEGVSSSAELMKKFGLKIFSNIGYKYCNTYPSKLILPYQILECDLLEIAQFRTKGRMPILSFVHKNGRLMYRSGQITTGFFSNRSKADEMLLYYIGQPLDNINRDDYLKYSQLKNHMSKKTLKICDARSYTAAYGNKIMGAGFENCEKNYLNCVLSFHSIANIHDVKNSSNVLLSFRSPLTKNKKGFYKALGESRWYDYLSDILEFAVEIAQTLNMNKHNVLIHCSDGWDRTSQIAAIVQILLDKKFRTIKGFLRLIEKEFTDAGFQFSTRCGLFNNKPIRYTLEINERREIYFLNTNETKDSPIFMQFLDCIRQLVIQKPQSFEFNLDLINELAYCLQLGVFKELLFDSQAIRMKHNHKNSMLDYFEYYLTDFQNLEYDGNSNIEITDIKTDDLYFKIWDELIYENFPVDEKNLIY